MDFYQELIKIDDDDLETFIEERIALKEMESSLCNDGNKFIGYELSHNPHFISLEEAGEDISFAVDLRCFHAGYIEKGTKIIYGMAYDGNGIATNDGRYYYVDDDSYIYDFCRYIKNKEIINEYELFDYILEFIRNYFGQLKTIDREEMFKMINLSQRIYRNPVKEHGLSWFKGNGSALCSEYSVLAQNLLTIFGFDSYLVIGREKTGDETGESHAFNLVEFTEQETNELIQALIDFCNYVDIFDINFHKIGETPFFALLEQLDEEFVLSLVNNEEHLTFDDYSCVLIHEHLGQLVYDRKRDYYISNEIIPDSYIIRKNKI